MYYVGTSFIILANNFSTKSEIIIKLDGFFFVKVIKLIYISTNFHYYFLCTKLNKVTQKLNYSFRVYFYSTA